MFIKKKKPTLLSQIMQKLLGSYFYIHIAMIDFNRKIFQSSCDIYQSLTKEIYIYFFYRIKCWQTAGEQQKTSLWKSYLVKS